MGDVIALDSRKGECVHLCLCVIFCILNIPSLVLVENFTCLLFTLMHF